MQRGTTPVVGILLLLSITVVAAATLSLAVATPPSEPPPTAVFGASVAADSDRITLTHRGGESLDVTDISIQITVDGQKLEEQPPVPFFAAAGFESGPTGPINVASPDQWHAGETASFRLASTNEPQIEPGDAVRIRIYGKTGQIVSLTETA